ncbi:MAG: class B sortase [Lachnospiraceae bacterium]|nr:class B sortase [Lachnospiraceae bacterium]
MAQNSRNTAGRTTAGTSRSSSGGKIVVSERRIAENRTGTASRASAPTVKTGSMIKSKKDTETAQKKSAYEAQVEAYVREELKRQEKKRKLLIAVCSILGALCLVYVGFYSYEDYRTRKNYEEMAAMKESKDYSQYLQVEEENQQPTINYTNEEKVIPEVLEEYKNLYNMNKKLIGWLKIDDTNIDYPVMQTTDNEYYLTHNINQEKDRNGALFLDKDCDVLEPSTNLIIYGHHMRSGRMFGHLDDYESEKFYKEHSTIQFDTIYEKGTYEIMYVFRSKVFSENEVVFKYYQFIDCYSEKEFESNMKEMAAISLYDTGVTAEYGDELLTLSTCDNSVDNGRFVVVAKRVD